jgi:hypothetical protein
MLVDIRRKCCHSLADTFCLVHRYNLLISSQIDGESALSQQMLFNIGGMAACAEA